jgi:hypothetical protein
VLLAPGGVHTTSNIGCDTSGACASSGTALQRRPRWCRSPPQHHDDAQHRRLCPLDPSGGGQSCLTTFTNLAKSSAIPGV